MAFFTYWSRSGSNTLICFDLPAKVQNTVQSMFSTRLIDRPGPYSAFLLILDELVRIYSDSVWSIRNYVSDWEARRSHEADYPLLHEIARHGIHVSETLQVAIRSLGAIYQQHVTFRSNTYSSRGGNASARWDNVGNRFQFQLRCLEGLLERSHANNARIQNEITLAFNAAAQRDSRIQVQISEDARKEASAMKAIAVVTMTFLPATFVSTLFGMSFFSFEPGENTKSSSFNVSNRFWIFWALSAPLTIATLGLWFLWSRRSARLR